MKERKTEDFQISITGKYMYSTYIRNIHIYGKYKERTEVHLINRLFNPGGNF